MYDLDILKIIDAINIDEWNKTRKLINNNRGFAGVGVKTSKIYGYGINESETRKMVRNNKDFNNSEKILYLNLCYDKPTLDYDEILSSYDNK